MISLVRSFNPRRYSGFIRQPLLNIVGAFIVFVLVLSVTMTYYSYSFIDRIVPQAAVWVGDNFETVFGDIPVLEIENGTIVSPTEVYLKRWNENFAFVIEPVSENVYPILERYENVVILAQKKMVVKFTKDNSLEESEIKTYNLNRVDYFKLSHRGEEVLVDTKSHQLVLTRENVQKTISRVAASLWPFLLVFFFFYYSGAKLIQVFVFSAFSLIFNYRLQAGCSYAQLFIMGVYALVPPTALAVVCSVFHWPIPFFGGVYSLIYVGYLFFAVKAQKGLPSWKE